MGKKFFILGAVLWLTLSMYAHGFAAVENQPAIELDGVKMQAAAHLDGGNLYLPLRAVGEALGYKIDWSKNGPTIAVSKLGKNIVIDLQGDKVTANDHVYYLGGDYLGIASGTGTTTYMGADFFSDNLGLQVCWDRQGGKVQLERVKENAISIKTVQEASETDEIKITLQYPQLDGLADKTVQDSINSICRQAAAEARDKGLRNAEEMRKVMASGYTGSPNKCETYFDYRLKYNQNGLLSIVFTDYQYAGGAHGITVQSSRTFDLQTGAEYTLQDLFRSGADYVTLISNAVRAGIDARIEEGILCENTPFQSIKDNQDFYLANHGLVVYFQPYEYFPYAAGIQEFPVDFPALQDMFKSAFSFWVPDAKLLEAAGTPNFLKVGETGRVILKGNPTTGYAWHYNIENSDLVKLDSAEEVRDSGMLGAGSTYIWSFKALKAGETKITFQYYRDWEGAASATADNTVEYLISVNSSL